MLMTGRSVFRTPPLNAKTYDRPTLGSVFNQAGYATLYCGKPGNTFRPANELFSKFVYNDGSDKARPAQSEFMADTAIAFLKEHRDRPMFLLLAPPVPHDPRVAPKQFMEMYDPAKITLPKNFMPMHPFDNGELNVRDEKLAPTPRTPEEMRRHIADYYACISCLDHHTGRILDAVKELGLADNTIIIYTSDQGLSVGGRHGLMGKQNLYEEFKSPLIIAGPGVPKGKSDALIYLYDLFPTCCDLAGLPIPKECEGASLVPIMKGEKTRLRELLFAPYKDCQRMVRDERWKLLWYPKINRFQLFDLSKDPWEIDDLSDKPEHAAKFAEMKKHMAAQQKWFGDEHAPVVK
jgi:arylsulfatase A-like enzyme